MFICPFLEFRPRMSRAFGRAVRRALPFLRVEVSSAARLPIPCPEVLSKARFPSVAGKATCVLASFPSLPVHPGSGDAKFPPKSLESWPREANVPRHTRPARPARRGLPWPTLPYPPQTRRSSIWQDAPPGERDDSDRNTAAAPSRRRSGAEPTPTPAQTPIEALSADFQIDDEAADDRECACRTRRGVQHRKAHQPWRAAPRQRSLRCSLRARGSTLRGSDKFPSQPSREGSLRCLSALLLR